MVYRREIDISHFGPSDKFFNTLILNFLYKNLAELESAWSFSLRLSVDTK